MKIVAVVQETTVYTPEHGGVDTCSSTVVYATDEDGSLFRYWIGGEKQWFPVELPPFPAESTPERH